MSSPPELGGDDREFLFHLALGRHVEVQRRAPAAEAIYPLRSGFRRGKVDVRANDVGTGFGENFAELDPETAARPGDQCHRPRQIEHRRAHGRISGSSTAPSGHDPKWVRIASSGLRCDQDVTNSS